MSRPNYTDQQAAAITTRGVSIALSAGAGCGKTFVLTQRFLQQLEPGPAAADLATLVAITFTDRAAREMRDRVREACQERLQQCEGSDVEHWLGVLRGLDSARISTIHSFCTSLLRANAVEAALDPRFAVLEPPLAETLLQTAAESVVHRLLIVDDPDTVAFVLKFGLERTRELMAQLARQRFRVDWSAWDHVTAESLAAQWQRRWQTEFVPKLIEELRTGTTSRIILELLQEHQPDHAEMQRRCADVAAGLDPALPWADPLSELNALRDAAKVQGGGGKSVWSSEDLFEAVKDRFSDLRDEIDRLLKQVPIAVDDVRLAAEFACRGLRLARQVAESYESLKRQSGALDFDDLLLKARDLLRDHSDVQRRFALGIRLLMVDEFQDTDPVQAEIVRSLCGEALRHGKLFLVGDVKQSIYRFRRADPQVFRALRDELPPHGQMSLTKNFRSQPAVLHFVNVLFATEFKDYEALDPFKNEQLSPVPAIEFLFATQDADVAVVMDDHKPKAEELRRREADWMARRIVELLADATPRVRQKNPATGAIELRRVQAGDIAILFRALTNVQEYEGALHRYGLDYYLVAGKAFFAQQEVFDLLNLCRCLDDPDDVVALVGVLRSPMFGLNDDALHALRPEDGDWFNRLLQPPPGFLPEFLRDRIVFAGRTLHTLRDRKDRVSIADLLTEAVTLTGFDAALLAEHLGSRKVANLRKLIDQAAAFDRSELFTLKDYVERLQTSVLQETDEEFATTLPETGEVIRLMSIHQSKGLEFPVVIVADIDRKGPPKGANAYLHPEWGALVKLPEEFGVEREHLALRMLKLEETAADAEETLRLFYVAVTRAADHLLLSAGVEPAAKRNSPWLQLLERKFDLLTGLPKGDPLLGSAVGVRSRIDIPEIKVHRTPPFATPAKSHREAQPLTQFEANLRNAVPELLPESTRVINADSRAPRTWSVSQLEQIDAELQPAQVHPVAEISPDAVPLTMAEEIGTLVHAALERLDFADLPRWSTVVEEAIRGSRQTPESAVVETARQLVERFALSPLAEQCAASRQMFREVDFLLPWTIDGTSQVRDVVSGQIDLCCEDSDGRWRIYDFKTIDDRGRRADAVHLAPYAFQLGVYALALEAWLQQSIQSAALVVLRPSVREVVLKWDELARVETRTRLTRALGAARQSEAQG